MTKRLYSTNQEALNKAIKCIKEKNIIRFKTQNKLFCFIEDIKNPWIRSRGFRRGTMPHYMGEKNYGPIINKLIEMNVLFRYQDATGKRTVSFDVNRSALNTLAVQ